MNVVGRVKGANWFMISEGGAGSGYVYSQLLKRDLDAVQDVAQQPKPSALTLRPEAPNRRFCTGAHLL